jgi:hypothetical protein
MRQLPESVGAALTRAIVEPIIEEIVAVSRDAGKYAMHVEYEIGNPLPLDDLVRYEKSSECVFPSDYREFVQSMNGFILRFYSMTPDGRPRSHLYDFQVLGVPEIFVETTAFRREILQEARDDESEEIPFPEQGRALVESCLLLCPRSTIFHPRTSEVFRMSRINMFMKDFLIKIADSFSDFLMESLRTTLENRGIPPTAYLDD